MWALATAAAPLLPPVAAQLFTTTTTPPPEYFSCDTATCALHDEWLDFPPENLTNDTRTRCEDVQEAALAGFGIEAAEMCKEYSYTGREWPDCRARYCEMYDEMVQRLVLEDSNYFFGGAECRPLLNFNRTLCDQGKYRDSDAFCKCVCPEFRRFVDQTCIEKIMAFLILGRRGQELFIKHQLGEGCAHTFCDFMRNVGDPSTPWAAVQHCQELELLFRPFQCKKVMRTQPYDACPWRQDTGQENVMRCADDFEDEIDLWNVDSWDFCESHEMRWQCPSNFEVMCSDPLECLGGTDYCCAPHAGECTTLKERGCSPLIDMELPEWVGIKPVPDPLDTGPTTTLSAAQLALLAFTTTTSLPSTDTLMLTLPIVLTVLGIAGIVAGVIICTQVFQLHVRAMASIRFGVAKMFYDYNQDPVLVIHASGKLADPNREKPLPIEASWRGETEKERLDRLAHEELKLRVERAERKFNGHGVNLHKPDPPEVAPLRAALATVYERGLEYLSKNFDLVARGERWMATFNAERALAEATEAARPDIEVAATLRPSPVPSQHEKRGEVRKVIWERIENLTEALRDARAKGADYRQIDACAKVLADLVAAMPELPSDRCVPSPTGQGLSLLPQGRQRAIFQRTGANYTYVAGTQDADKIGNIFAPRGELGSVSSEGPRALCAAWYASGSCSNGLKCPFEHSDS